MSRGYGSKANEYFGLPPAPALRSSMISTLDAAITRIIASAGAVELTNPIPAENAFVLCLQLRDVPRHELWFDAKPVPVRPYASGEISVVDLAARPVAYLPTAFDTLQFYIPEMTLRRISDAEGTNVIRELAIPHGTKDPTVEAIGALLLPAVMAGSHAPGLFVDGLLLALHSHLAQTYATIRTQKPIKTGALAPWQEIRAKAIIDAHLEGGLSIMELALECDLSPTYFCRAFGKSTGTTPHQWLMRRRVEVARELLTCGTLPLADIAAACGFSDQSHFSRIFSRATGLSPGACRKLARNGTVDSPLGTQSCTVPICDV